MLIALLLAATTAGPPIPVDQAQRVFDEIRLASEEDAGKLWGQPLYGPILLVDRATRFAVANVRDAEGKLTPSGGVFVGTLPESVIVANTSTNWSGTRWTMIVWSAVAERTVPRRRLVLHECWHRIQNDIGFPSQEKPNPHLESVDSRSWLQLELRALAAALRSSGETRTNAIRDAVTFRARHRAESERLLENNEGLAEYTGWALRGTSDVESQQTFARQLTNIDRNADFARSFAYLTGPAYGLLLDALDPGWTRRYKATDDLAETLARAAKVKADGGNASGYGSEELRAFEERRAAERKEKLADYRRRFIEGPTLDLPMANARYGFDPDRVTALETGSVHPTLNVTADWGTLAATSGAMISSDFTRIIIPAPPSTEGSPIAGYGWTLTLDAGWRIVPGDRPGDFRVTRGGQSVSPR